MNKKGQFDLELDESWIMPIVLGVLGAFVGLFTAAGGFSAVMSANEGWNPSLATRLGAAIGGFVIGVIWGLAMQK